MTSERRIDGVGEPGVRRRVARWLRVTSTYADGGAATAVLLGREDAAACAGALSAVLRSAAELLEGPSQP